MRRVCVCGYFWLFIGLNLFSLFIASAALAVATGLLYFITSPIWYQFISEPTIKETEVFQIGSGLDIVIIGLGLIIRVRVLFSKKNSGFIGVIKSYLWGVRNKVCPMIEYKEE